MSTKHKDALAQGRTEGRIIRMYLEIVEANKPKRGRKRTADFITQSTNRGRIDVALLRRDRRCSNFYNYAHDYCSGV